MPRDSSTGSTAQTAVSLSLYREPWRRRHQDRGPRCARRSPELQAHAAGRRAARRSCSDESVDLAKQLRDLMLRGTIAFVAVFLVLFITLRSSPGGSLVIGSAAIAIAGAALALYLLHIPANMLTLAGLGMGIGILVQNGLVVVERLRAARNTAEDRARPASGSRRRCWARRSPPRSCCCRSSTCKAMRARCSRRSPARSRWRSSGRSARHCVFVPAVGQGRDGQPHGWPRLARLYERMVAGTLRWRTLTIAFTVVALAVLTWGFIKKVPRVDWGRGFGADARRSIARASAFRADRIRPRSSTSSPNWNPTRSASPVWPWCARGEAPRRATSAVEFTAEGSQGDAPWVVSDKLTERAVLIGGTDHIYVTKPRGPRGSTAGRAAAARTASRSASSATRTKACFSWRSTSRRGWSAFRGCATSTSTPARTDSASAPSTSRWFPTGSRWHASARPPRTTRRACQQQILRRRHVDPARDRK